MKAGSTFFPKGPDPSRRENERREAADRYLAERGREERRPRGLVRVLVVVLCMFVAGFFFENTVPVPDNAWVYADARQGVYFAPPYLKAAGRDGAGLVRTRVAEARKMNYKPDPEARSRGYFQQPDRSMSGGLLQALAVLPPLPSRWNRDGTWNW